MKGNLLPIRLVGDHMLKQVAKPVETITPELVKFFKDLTYTMYETDGIGLAAPQVGRSLRVFVVDPDWAKEEGVKKPIVMVNPEFLDKKGELQYEEGCLSIPGIFETVNRFNYVKVRYQDEKGEFQEVEAWESFAVVIQHEYDHLDGVLFIDRIPKLKLWPLRRRIRQIESTTTPEGINIRPQYDR